MIAQKRKSDADREKGKPTKGGRGERALLLLAGPEAGRGDMALHAVPRMGRRQGLLVPRSHDPHGAEVVYVGPVGHPEDEACPCTDANTASNYSWP